MRKNTIEPTKKELLILKNGKEIYFSHWEKNNNNGIYFFDTKFNKYSLKDLA